MKEYVNSNDFTPTYEVNRNFLKKLFPLIPKVEKANTNNLFENVILQVNAAGKLQELNTNKPWSNDLDDIEIADGTKYKVKAEGVWKDNHVTAWYGKNMTIEVNCPKGILGSFFVYFNDWNNQGREGILEFEGRKVKLERHDGEAGIWVRFHVMREDSNDGRLILKSKLLNGGNLMIDKIILNKE